MKNKLFITFVVTFGFAVSAFGQSAVVTVDDIKILEGKKWIGTLTYLDYSSNNKTAIPSELTVTKIERADGSWNFSYEYPKEPKSNNFADATVENSGRTFNGQKVIEKTVLADKTIRIVATKDGDDNGKKALFRYTYLIAPESFSIKKEVQIAGTSKWFERNTYSWQRGEALRNSMPMMINPGQTGKP